MLLQFLSLSRSPRILCFSFVFLPLCFVYISLALYLPPSLLPSLHPSFPPFEGAHVKFSLNARLAVGAPLEGGWWAGGGALVFSAIPLDEALEQGNESFGNGLETSHSSV